MEINAHWPHKCGTFMNKGKKNKQSSRPSLVPLVRVIWYWRNWGEHNSFFTIYTEMRLRSFLRIPLSGCFLVVLLNFSRLKKKVTKCWQGYWVPMKIQVCVRSVLLTFHCYLEFAATHALDTVLTCGINLDCSQHRLLYFTSSSTFVWITLLAKMIIYVTFCCRIFLLFLLISYVQIWLRLD